MDKTVNIHEAKTHFSKLLRRVRCGERIIIAKAGKSIVVISPIGEVPKDRIPGEDLGFWSVHRILTHLCLSSPVRAKLVSHTFRWWNIDDPQLSNAARDFIADGNNEIFLSTASAWEIAIKCVWGRLILPEEPGEYVSDRIGRNHFRPLPVQISHALQAFDLPEIHQDPVDRLLIAQSQLEDMPILSGDSVIPQYYVNIIW